MFFVGTIVLNVGHFNSGFKTIKYLIKGQQFKIDYNNRLSAAVQRQVYSFSVVRTPYVVFPTE